jgi:bisphosphoglycerate-independent phosphoglycerate mutase (AlkP superfamily)
LYGLDQNFHLLHGAHGNAVIGGDPGLCKVAHKDTTLLELLDIEKPAEMTGKSLFC